VHLVVSVFLALFISQAAAPAATGGMSGRVIADGTNAPIAGARVIVFPAGPRAGHVPAGPPPHETTDQDGRFAFSKLTPGEYVLNLQKTGFAPLNDPMARPRTFTVAAGPGLSVDVRLQRGVSSSAIGMGTNEQSAEIVVTDADVIGVRVVTRRPNTQ
jgi:Carboxypeptidase regulatory-like domain